MHTTINGLSLSFAEPSFALTALEAGAERWLASPAGEPLWALLAVDEDGRRVTLTGAQAAEAWTDFHDDMLTLYWAGVRDAATGAGPFEVRVEIRPLEEPGETGWRIAVGNAATAWTLWSVTFPSFAGLQPSGHPEEDRLFYPHGWGRQVVGRANMPELRRRYPRGWDFAMQCFGYARDGRVLTLAAHDPRLTTKEFLFHPDGRLGVINYPEGMSTPGNQYRQSWDTVVAITAGDWYDAARRYGDWARQQPWAQAPRPQQQVQAWQVLFVPQRPPEEWGTRMEHLAERLGVPLGIHFYDWHQIPFDTDYPDYFPAREGFKELVARMKAAGLLTMPYINGRIWDINAPSWRVREAERFAAKGSAQRLHPKTLFPYLEEYGSGQKLAPMCPTTGRWQETIVALCRRIIEELGCDGVYIDQVAAEKAELCFDPAHGHPLGGGGFWLAGYRQMLARIRAAIGPHPFLTTECNWEGAIADFDALLMWHSFPPGLIPFFPAAYAGLARTFGCQFTADDLIREHGKVFADRMAMLFTWGAELGWGDLTLLLDTGNEPLCAYFAELCRLRAEYHAFFTQGRLLRPPVVTPENLGLYASQWGLGEERRLFLVNPTRHPIDANVRLEGGESLQVSMDKLSAVAL